MDEKIVLLNVHSSMNVGDTALLESTLHQLSANFKGNHILLSMNDPANYRGDEAVIPSIVWWVHPIDERGITQWKVGHLIGLLPATLIPVLSKKWFKTACYWFTPTGLRKSIQAILEADLVAGVPGGYLYSSGRGIGLWLVMYSFVLAILAGKPLYLLPQSIGPIQHPWERGCLRWILERARIVMVREPVSLRLVQAYRLRTVRVRLMPDMAFALPPANMAGECDDWLREQGIDSQDSRPRLGITMINWGAQDLRYQWQDRYEQACVAAARWFVEHLKGRVIFFPQVWGPTTNQDDRVPARRAASQLYELGNFIHLVERPISMQMLQELYGRMDIFIGARMHSNIFALRKGVPVIAIGYQHKTQGIAEMVGISEWVIDIQQVNDQILIDRLRVLWEDRPAVRDHIQRIIPELVRQAEQVGEMIREDYTNLQLRG